MSKLTVVNQNPEHNLRADVFIFENAPVDSRSQATLLFRQKKISVNGKICKASYKVKPNDRFEVEISPKTNFLTPYKHGLDIVYEDEDLLVINKPSGLVTHPGAGHISDTLVNVLIYNNKTLSTGFHPIRPGIVHRLDKDTSGLMLVAKNNEAHINLSKQFEEKSISRIYQAIVYKKLEKKSGKIVSYLQRHPVNRKIFRSAEVGKLAITNYEVLKSVKDYSLLKLKLETGRTHQIRVHLYEMGHPILGDKIYKYKNLKITIPQMALHSMSINFDHPTTGKKLMFKSNWDKKMLAFQDKLFK